MLRPAPRLLRLLPALRKGLELPQLLTLVEPHFGQLTVFDPRFPHGVRPVHGTKDPQRSRLVLHGAPAGPPWLRALL
jgi:Rps23 Pro-64 3,4-dihydroxylase Tpa1-like proline 4-hydroxylase